MNSQLHFYQFRINLEIYRSFSSCFLKSAPESPEGSKLNFCKTYKVHSCETDFLKVWPFYTKVPPAKYWSQGSTRGSIPRKRVVNDFLKSKAWQLCTFHKFPHLSTQEEKERFSTDIHSLLYLRFSATQGVFNESALPVWDKDNRKCKKVCLRLAFWHLF